MSEEIRGAPAGSPRKTILVIDDQDDERAIQRAMLGHLGYDVREAGDGHSGVEAARQTPPDLILLDIAMPNMDGFEVCHALRSDQRTQAIPILFFTATVLEDMDQRVRDSGARGLLMKPIDPHQVATEVRRLIGTPEP